MKTIVSTALAVLLGFSLIPAHALPKDGASQSLERHQTPKRSTKLEVLLQLAASQAEAGDFESAAGIYESLIQSSDAWHSWAGVSGLVAVHRAAGNFTAAHEVVARVAAERPELTGLMHVWAGDTDVLEGNLNQAISSYRRAFEEGSNTLIQGLPVEAIALRQIARTHLALNDPATAAATERELLRTYPALPEREFTLARALTYEAMAAGDLPVKSVGELLHDGDCNKSSPCLVADGRAFRNAAGGRVLAGLAHLRFQLSRADEQLLSRAVAPDHLISVSAPICSPAEASNGFQYPMTNDHSGYVFMGTIPQGYHPGLDINGPGAGDADCGLLFKAVAQGCVTDASPTNWGSATVQHLYKTRTWTSQYGHAGKIYYSAGSAVVKGASLGVVGKIGASTCHLHHEIREQDHPAPTNADYYSSLTKANVGDWYQNPLPFINAHRSYLWALWADEGLFSLTGSWNYVSGVGDEDDMRWAYTTPTSSKTTYARLSFTPPSSGVYQLFVFVPYNYSTSSAAPYRVVRTGGTTAFSGSVNQNPLLDSWVSVGAGTLTGGVSYYVEVATNTGETSKRVGLDDILILKIYN